jgi:hypothetical protein
VAAVLAGIAQRSPNASVLVVNYSAIFPHAGPGCWPQMPVAEGDVPWLRAKQEELNAMLAAQAAAHGAEVIDVYAASRGHDACALPGRCISSVDMSSVCVAIIQRCQNGSRREPACARVAAAL